MKVGKGVFVLFALVLAACSTPSEPSSLETPSPEMTGSPGPTSSPTPPSAADEVSQAMDAFFTAANAASQGQDIDGFGALFSATCTLCATQLSNFSQAYAAGQQANGDLYESWTVKVEDLSEGSALVQTVVDTGEITLVDATGSTVEVFPAETDVTTIWTLNRNEAGAWIVVAAQDLP